MFTKISVHVQSLSVVLYKLSIQVCHHSAFVTVTVYDCFSQICKLDFYVLDGTLTGQVGARSDNGAFVISHFDGPPLSSRPILMDDNARPHMERIVQ